MFQQHTAMQWLTRAVPFFLVVFWMATAVDASRLLMIKVVAVAVVLVVVVVIVVVVVVVIVVILVVVAVVMGV